MSQENVEIVRESLTVTAYLAAIRDGDFGPLLVHFDPEVLVNQPPELPDAKSYRGHNGVVEALGDWPSQWDEFRADILEVIDGGETVVQLTHAKRLTSPSVSSAFPKFSPSGKKIVFSSARGVGAKFEAFVMKADGSHQHRLTLSASSNYPTGWGIRS
jgi:hypothetical protein